MVIGVMGLGVYFYRYICGSLCISVWLISYICTFVCGCVCRYKWVWKNLSVCVYTIIYTVYGMCVGLHWCVYLSIDMNGFVCTYL